MSIDYAFRPCLRIRLTPGGRTCPGKPWNSGGRDSHPAFRYSCPHNRLHAVHGGLRPRFEPHATLPYRPPLRAILQLRHRAYSRSFSARGLSTSQLLRNVPTSFVTERGLGALAGSLGCFPLDDGTYLSPSISRTGRRRHSEFAKRRYLARGLRLNSALPSAVSFRG